MKTIILILLFSLPTLTAVSQSPGDLPDVTIVYSGKPSYVGRVAKRWASRAQGYPATYTHVGIVLGGRVYHADYPAVTSRPVWQLKRGEVATYVLPRHNYSSPQVAAMKAYAQSQIGQPYRLRGFIRRNGEEGWCSQFVRRVLEQGGHNLSYQDGFTPDNLLRAIK